MSDKPERPETHLDEDVMTPVHEQSYKKLLIGIPKRIIGLVSKAIGVKMMMFYIATALLALYPETFPWYAWIIVYVVTLFGWDGLKFIKEIKK